LKELKFNAFMICCDNFFFKYIYVYVYIYILLNITEICSFVEFSVTLETSLAMNARIMYMCGGSSGGAWKIITDNVVAEVHKAKICEINVWFCQKLIIEMY